MSENRSYVAIDLKSFYASVECIERGLDPLTTNLVVADKGRTEKTICLAVSPSLKAYGIPGRARLFEVVSKVREVNYKRKMSSPYKRFTGKSYHAPDLERDPSLELDYVVAPPRMARYIEWSTRIYSVYLRHVAPEDIHVYSIDEVFIDVTHYLRVRGMSGREFAAMLVKEVLAETGITATAGVGTNLYLCKVAMDIVAKHVEPDSDGVRIAELDETSYRKLLWNHRPLTDFWRVGRGYSRTLESHGLYTMGDIARCSLGKPTDRHNEDLLYKLFGVNAELLIDHAWGCEPCTMKEIKAYKPESNSLGSGQVLHCPYTYDKARLIVREMADALALDLVEKGLVAERIVLTVGYDIENLSSNNIGYDGDVTVDFYGRKVPKHAHGTASLDGFTSSARAITDAADSLYERIVDSKLFVRRINITADHVVPEESVSTSRSARQLDLFTDYEEYEREQREKQEALKREKKVQSAIIDIKKRFGKNAILKGMNFEDGSTAKDRNSQIGGHKA